MVKCEDHGGATPPNLCSPLLEVGFQLIRSRVNLGRLYPLRQAGAHVCGSCKWRK